MLRKQLTPDDEINAANAERKKEHNGKKHKKDKKEKKDKKDEKEKKDKKRAKDYTFLLRIAKPLVRHPPAHLHKWPWQ